MLQLKPYIPPPWTVPFIPAINIPSNRITLGTLPTPTHRLSAMKYTIGNFDIFIKRDDMTSCDMSGNKLRKLEFLLADAIAKGHDSVVTIGGLQSNHARATAIASRLLQLEPHLILRTALSPSEIDLTGNLLFNRLISAKICTVSPSTYAQIGSKELTSQLCKQLRETQGLNPYEIPVGGSNCVGLFGYFECVNEILKEDIEYDHIVIACGSGGTAMGVSLGFRLYEMYQYSLQPTTATKNVNFKVYKPHVHAIIVCDSPDYFYSHIENLCQELGVDMSAVGSPRSWLTIHSGVGLGYARSTDEELRFIVDFATQHGVVLDPVYSGKAMYTLKRLLKETPNRDDDVDNSYAFLPGQKILFIHTGGVFGLYDKANQLQPILATGYDINKMNVERP